MEQARDVSRAAAATFYRQTPWRSKGGDEPIKVESGLRECDPQFDIVPRKKGRGL